MRLVGVDEAASYLGLSRHTLGRWARAGEAPSYRVGGRRLYDLDELEGWIQKHREGPPVKEDPTDG